MKTPVTAGKISLFYHRPPLFISSSNPPYSEPRSGSVHGSWSLLLYNALALPRGLAAWSNLNMKSFQCRAVTRFQTFNRSKSSTIFSTKGNPSKYTSAWNCPSTVSLTKTFIFWASPPKLLKSSSLIISSLPFYLNHHSSTKTILWSRS